MSLNDYLISDGFVSTGSHISGDGTVSNLYGKNGHTVISISHVNLQSTEEIPVKKPQRLTATAAVAILSGLVIGFAAGCFFHLF